MRRTRTRIDAETATALSTEMRDRAIQLKKGNPQPSDDQFNAAMRAAQKELIREPWGEPGRSPDKINPKSGKPRGYNLQTVLGLAGNDPVYNHYFIVIKRHATALLEMNQTYSGQRLSSITTVVVKSLNELPVFHLYDDNWPIHAYLKGILRAKANQKQETLADIEFRDPEADDAGPNGHQAVPGPPAPIRPALPAPDAPAPAPAPLPSSNRARTPATTRARTSTQPAGLDERTQSQARMAEALPRAAAENAHRDIEEFGSEPNPDSDVDDDDEARGFTPPVNPPPLKKRGRADPDKNLPGTRNPQAKKLKTGPKKQVDAQESNAQHPDPPQVTTRKTTKKKTSKNADPEPGPGPTTMAHQKKLARQKAKVPQN